MRSLLTALFLAPALLAQDFDFRAAMAYSTEKDGLAVLVAHKGRLVFEEYTGGHTKDKGWHIYSGTKSFAPMVALVAADEGLLTLDEKVSDTISEWRDDARKKDITVRHLLTFTSGILQAGTRGATSTYGAALAAKTEADPGKRFRYGSNHLRVFGELLERKLAKAAQSDGAPRDFVAYLKDRILDPIGCEFTFWMRDRKKDPALSYGAFLTAREWLEFGQLVLQRGRWAGKQIVPSKHFDECFQGTKANPIYGLNWWLIGKAAAARRGSPVPKDTVAAKGMFGQNLYVIPSLDLVVVRFGKNRSRARLSDGAFLGRLLGGAARTAANGAGDRALVERAVRDYVEALYQAKPELIRRSVDPGLVKLGWYRRKQAEDYRGPLKMTFEQLVELSGRWNKDGQQGEDLEFQIKVLDVLDRTANARLEAKWGIDHMLLHKRDGKWKILQVLWQSHPTKKTG